MVPVFFAGQNSRLFQIASHISLTLRLSLFFKEVYDKIGSEIHLRVGDPIPYKELASLDRKELMEYLRRKTYALGARNAAWQRTRQTAALSGEPNNRDIERCRVGLLVTCLADLFRPEMGFAAVKLLELAGCDVDVPAQTCCGQPAYNAGDRRDAVALARKIIAAFEPFDYIVVPSGSCAGMLRVHYPGLFTDDPEWRARAEASGREDPRIVFVSGEYPWTDCRSGEMQRQGALSQFLFVAARNGRRERAAPAAEIRIRTDRAGF